MTSNMICQSILHLLKTMQHDIPHEVGATHTHLKSTLSIRPLKCMYP